MIKIKVPATSANLGPGFDVLGIAFNLYNSFRFEESEEFQMIGFEKRYEAVEKNLVCQSYIKAFESINETPIPIKIYMDTQDVPTSRGLGSSATCIVAGVLAAKYYLKGKLSLESAFQIATGIEGHPDNVAPAMFGGLIASYKDNDIYKHIRYDVSSILKFNVLVPDFELSTHESRSVLPHELPYSDIVYNTARIANIPYAFYMGNLNLIKDLLSDKMHEPYRMRLIKGAEDIKKRAHENGCAFAISGAGPSLLVISEENINNKFNDFSNWKIYNLAIAKDGAIVIEM
ncbi:MAG: homoserine kinase [Anaeroplasmataceae bacterium]